MLKQTSKLIFTLLAGSIIVSSALAAEQQRTNITPQDFAYAIPLQFEGQDALYQTTLPLSVYQHTVRSDLGDIRVFNAQGEVVPYMLQQPERSSPEQPEQSELAYFPLNGPAHADLDELSLRVRRDATGTLIDIGSHNSKHASQGILAGYLLDTSAFNKAVQALVLDWDFGRESFVGTITLESSDDLKQWHNVLSDAPLASLQYGGHNLLQNRIEFPAQQAKYLRLSWPQNQVMPPLRNIVAELSAVRIETPLSWLPAIKGSAVENKTGEYQFDLGAHLPVQRMRIALPQMNTVVQASIFSRARPEDAWHPVCNTVLYKLRHADQVLNNPDINVNSRHRYWLLRVDNNSGGLGTGMPEMQIGWQPHLLQFVARGSPPFQLAYGSKDIKPAEFQLQQAIPATQQNKPALAIQQASTGTQITLGGEQRLIPEPEPLPWKKWLLWAMLGLAVLLLGWMAYRLAQQMEHHRNSQSQQ